MPESSVSSDQPLPPPPSEQPTLAREVADQSATDPTLTQSSAPSIEGGLVADARSVSELRSFGDYELLGEIARGGMGIVYRARERRSGRLVALKMMLADSAVDAGYLQRFILEAQATAELTHPGIVAIHAWGQHESQFFYTMDYVPGFPLSRIIKRRPLAVDRAVRYLLGITRAVAAAHAQGIIHRDLKPSNIVVDPADQPRVLDFGLAKRQSQQDEIPVPPGQAEEDVVDALPVGPVATSPTGSSSGQSSPYVTEKGAVLGTPSYMAPEQARGEHAQVGPPADVHALGAIFYEMLTGRPPFEAQTMMDTLIQVMEKQPVPVRSLNAAVPVPLEELCLRCLQKDPKDRHVNAAQLAEDLQERWLRHTMRCKFARLSAWSGLALVGLLLAQALFMAATGWSSPRHWSDWAERFLSFGGPLMQNAASNLAFLFGCGFILLPFAGLTAFLCWVVGWIRFSLATSASDASAGRSSSGGSGSYLQRLFVARVGATPGTQSRAPVTLGIELADMELGRTLQDGEHCTLRRGHQKSLNRPVLVWTAKATRQAGSPAPGIVVHHPSVLALHAVGSGSDGDYMVTGPATAIPLAELTERNPISPLEAAFLLVKVAHAVEAFHTQGACHGRLHPEWILVQGDLEPLLCPCGVPGMAETDRVADTQALGQLLQAWLPPRPRRWIHQPLGILYSVTDAAAAGKYRHAADLARDVEQAARAARIRWRERIVGWAALILFALPAIFAPALALVFSTSQEGSGNLDLVTRFLANHLLLLVAPGVVLQGFVYGRALAHHLRLRLHPAVSQRMLSKSLVPAMVRLALFTLAPVLIAMHSLWYLGQDISARVFFLGVGMMAGYVILGGCFAFLFSFGEILLASLRAADQSLQVASWGRADAGSALPSPQEAARSIAGRVGSLGPRRTVH